MRSRGTLAFALLAAFVLAVGVALVATHRNRNAYLGSPGVVPHRTLGAFANVPVFAPLPATAFALEAHALGVDPDGALRYLVRVRFTSANGEPTTLVRGGDIAFDASRGSAQWQTRARFDAPAAIVSLVRDGRATVVVTANPPLRLPPHRVRLDPRAWTGPRVAARALGPHLIQLGWFPASPAAVRIVRSLTTSSSRIGAGTRAIALHVVPSVSTFRAAAGASTFRDTSVEPGSSYVYRVAIAGRATARFAVRAPAEPAHRTISALAGKAMWFSFSPVAGDSNGYDTLDPARIVARAKRAGVAALEIRTAYGEFDELAPAARPAIDALLDDAAAAGIATIGWTVPRAATFEDLSRAVATATYRTPRGNGFAALAIDLERGDAFLGDGRAGFAAIATYARLLRAALGPRYPIAATVEDPYLEHLTASDYPYAAVAAQVDALQPMAYWRMMTRSLGGEAGVRSALTGSYTALARVAGRRVPIDIGGQTSGEGPRGAPPPLEIAAAIRTARALGALGIAFFDYDSTSARAWRAIAATPWNRTDEGP